MSSATGPSIFSSRRAKRGNTVICYFSCPVCEERRMKEVGVNNAFLATKVVESCKKGHEMKLDRTEER